MKAALYARFSTENQRDASIEDQFRECEKVAKAQGFDIVARLEDRGISGGTSERPGYQMLLAGARGGMFEVIVVEDISRLWRNRGEFGAVTVELEDRGVHIVTCVGDDTRRDGYGLVLGIKQAIAEHQRREIGYRTRRGMAGLALAGKSTGGRTYGYDGPGGSVGPQAAIVQDIFGMALQGRSASFIATQLNARKIPGPRGKGWAASTVDCMLRNERYTGRIVWGAYENKASARNSRRRTLTRRGEPLVDRVDPALAIVGTETFKRVQEMRGR